VQTQLKNKYALQIQVNIYITDMYFESNFQSGASRVWWNTDPSNAEIYDSQLINVDD